MTRGRVRCLDYLQRMPIELCTREAFDLVAGQGRREAFVRFGWVVVEQPRRGGLCIVALTDLGRDVLERHRYLIAKARSREVKVRIDVLLRDIGGRMAACRCLACSRARLRGSSVFKAAASCELLRPIGGRHIMITMPWASLSSELKRRGASGLSGWSEDQLRLALAAARLDDYSSRAP